MFASHLCFSMYTWGDSHYSTSLHYWLLCEELVHWLIVYQGHSPTYFSESQRKKCSSFTLRIFQYWFTYTSCTSTEAFQHYTLVMEESEQLEHDVPNETGQSFETPEQEWAEFQERSDFYEPEVKVCIIEELRASNSLMSGSLGTARRRSTTHDSYGRQICKFRVTLYY